MLRNKYAARVAGVALAAVALVSCGTSNDQPNTSPSAAQSGEAATRTVVDMDGRSVQIPATVERIGTNYPALNQAIFMLGEADRIVATSSDMRTTVPLFATMYPRLKEISAPFAAGTPDVNTEELLADRPDVVFLSSAGKALLPTMERLGIPALVFASFKSPEELKAGITLVADVLGGDAKNRAQEFTSYYDANIKRVESATADIPPADRPKAYYTAGDPLQTEGDGSIVKTWMDSSGASNVAADNGISAPPTFATVSFEDVAKWNPDVIICRQAKTRDDILADPRWRDVAAVQNDRVFASPRGVFLWSVRSAEAALMPLWAAKQFHPDRFADLDMHTEVKDFYSRFYSHDLTDQQIDEILNPS